MTALLKEILARLIRVESKLSRFLEETGHCTDGRKQK